MLAQTILAGQLLEAMMMICFGVSWPVAIVKTLRTRRTEGKSLAFLVLILVGYLAGIAAKLVEAAFAHAWPNWVTLLYLANAILVLTDIALFLKFRPRPAGLDLDGPTLP